MPIDAALFEQFEKPEGRRAVGQIYDALRDLILSGRLAPDMILSQVQLSRVLGVSRTPVREALRRLQEAGLVSAEPNFRCRVLGFDPADIEALYIKRILLESVAVAITTERMTAQQLADLRATVEALEGEDAHGSFEKWLDLHRQFHHVIASNIGAPLAEDLATLERRSERYQSEYKGAHMPGWWLRGEKEHREIFHAIEGGDAQLAAELTARHLARTALELLAALAPEHDSSALRTSLQFALQASRGRSDESASSHRRAQR